MRKKLFAAFLIVTLFAACSATNKDEMPPAKRFSQLQAEQVQSTTDIKLVNARVNVRHGENGTITIQGQPGVTYTITSAYKKGEKIITAHESRVADVNGRVTWSWSVRPDTVPGAYPITIAGGGKTLVTTYTVSR